MPDRMIVNGRGITRALSWMVIDWASSSLGGTRGRMQNGHEHPLLGWKELGAA